ncbi:hypothetical protein NLU13_2232 [Sarocladium strictum]|uniref:Aquaporin-like protein n=1 Tax=Sarocladium strictum TaxID=5046 RepID=A0AA39GSG7_SARSR|nr:hypothetical protein NLU13_2232 [Sarocladium strictum]
MVPDNTDTEADTATSGHPSAFKPAEADFAGSFAPATRPTDVRDRPWYRDGEYLLGGWGDVKMWKSAWIETTATAFLVYVSGMTTGTLLSYGTKQIGAYIGIANIFLLATFIYATAPASGGHLNPMITFSVVLSGMCPVSRGVAYMLGQTAGAALGGGILLGARVFLNEFFASMALIYLAYGVGLDPRQAEFYGPRMGPLLVGSSLGLISFATSGAVPGFAGAQMHPARCFGFGVAKRDMVGQWIWWFAPATAAILSALMYNLIPLDHGDDAATEKKRKKTVADDAQRHVEV